MKMDLNCDMGESFGNYRLGLDEEVMSPRNVYSPVPEEMSFFKRQEFALGRSLYRGRYEFLSSSAAIAIYQTGSSILGMKNPVVTLHLSPPR
jgi:hypothetical protein